MTSYNYYGWEPGLGFPTSNPYGTQGVNLTTTTGNPLPVQSPDPSDVNQATPNTTQNGVQPNLKAEIYKQCEDVVPSPKTMEMGLYLYSKKKWINNRLDMNDMWKMASNGGKVMLWCIRIGEKQKRSHEDALKQESACKNLNQLIPVSNH